MGIKGEKPKKTIYRERATTRELTSKCTLYELYEIYLCTMYELYELYVPPYPVLNYALVLDLFVFFTVI